MLTATKEFGFAMAHMLEGHEGLCLNIHGHEYKLQITVARSTEGANLSGAPVITEGPAEGMIIDFKALKEIVNEVIIEPLDHACMINIFSEDVVEQGLLNLLRLHERKVQEVNFRPTAENMVMYFRGLLNGRCCKAGLVIKGIRLYETPTSYAEWLA